MVLAVMGFKLNTEAVEFFLVSGTAEESEDVRK